MSGSRARSKYLVNLDEIDGVLRMIDREVWVLTAAAAGQRGGLTATFVSAASIDRERPVLLAGIGSGHFTAELIEAGGGFVAHLLRSRSARAWLGILPRIAAGSATSWLAWRRTTPQEASRSSPTASPGAIAACLPVTMRGTGGITGPTWSPPSGWAPASRCASSSSLRNLTDDQRRVLAASRQADVLAQRPLHERWRQRSGIRIAP